MTGECLDKSEKMQFVGEDDFLINAQQKNYEYHHQEGSDN